MTGPDASLPDFERGLLSRWSAYAPTRIVFGWGSLDELGQVSRPFGDRAFLITGGAAARTGLAERCRALLQGAGLAVETDHAVTADPTVHAVNRLAGTARAGATVLVAVGGGSVLDAAKAAAVVAGQGGTAEAYLTGERSVGSDALPVVAVPTVSGSGAELSRGAILTWPERTLKAGIRGEAVVPRAAVVDPALTRTLSEEYVAIAGFDVFAHALETYLSRRATPLTALLSRSAVPAVCRDLPRLLEDPEDREARSRLALYSMLMGYNLAHASTCLPHRLQYPVGVVTGTPHGLGLAALYPAWIAVTAEASRDRFAAAASWMGEGLGPPAGDVGGLVRRFLDRIALTPSLAALGVEEDQCPRLAGLVRESPANDPWWSEERETQDLARIYQVAWAPPPAPPPVPRAVILAAGAGRRIAAVSDDAPKSFLPLGERRLIDHQLDALRGQGIDDITLVVGYRRELFEREYAGDGLRLVTNPFFDCTNVLASLWFAREHLGSGFLFLHADTWCDPSILADLLAAPQEIVLAVQRKATEPEEMKVRLEGDRIIEISKAMDCAAAAGEFTGVARVGAGLAPRLVARLREAIEVENRHGEFFEAVLQELIDEGVAVHALDIGDRPSIEIDFPEDYDRARRLFQQYQEEGR